MPVANRFQIPRRVLVVVRSNKLNVRNSTHCTIANTRKFQSLVKANILPNPQSTTTLLKVVNAAYSEVVVTTNVQWSCTQSQCLFLMMDSWKLEIIRSNSREIRLTMLKKREVTSKTYTKLFKISCFSTKMRMTIITNIRIIIICSLIKINTILWGTNNNNMNQINRCKTWSTKTRWTIIQVEWMLLRLQEVWAT